MTQAVCFSCGRIKHGAFSSCENCGKEPRTNDDLALSMALTDHYFSHEQLMQMGAKIKAGEKLDVNPAQKAEIIDTIKTARNIDVLGNLLGIIDKKNKHSRKPWWKFW